MTKSAAKAGVSNNACKTNKANARNIYAPLCCRRRLLWTQYGLSTENYLRSRLRHDRTGTQVVPDRPELGHGVLMTAAERRVENGLAVAPALGEEAVVVAL